MGHIVRAAIVDDARAIAEIHVAGWRAAYRGHMPDAFLDGLSVEKRETQWRGWIGKPTSPEQTTWVAIDDGRVIAFATAGATRDVDEAAGVAELVAIYADPSRWGTGAGRALVDHVVENLRGRGFADLTVWVLDGNARARRFYEIAGFVADGAQKSATFAGAALREIRYRRGLGQ